MLTFDQLLNEMSTIVNEKMACNLASFYCEDTIYLRCLYRHYNRPNPVRLAWVVGRSKTYLLDTSDMEDIRLLEALRKGAEESIVAIYDLVKEGQRFNLTVSSDKTVLKSELNNANKTYAGECRPA